MGGLLSALLGALLSALLCALIDALLSALLSALLGVLLGALLRGESELSLLSSPSLILARRSEPLQQANMAWEGDHCRIISSEHF